MPKFNVNGVDKESGLDTDVVIYADNEANAKAKAEIKGMVVTSVVIDNLDALAAAPGTAIQMNVQQIPRTPNNLGIASLILGILAQLICWV